MLKNIICLLVIIISIPISASAISAKSAVLIDGASGRVLYQHKAYEKLPMAAVAIAEQLGGSVDAFALLMNKRAREIGALNTNFVNPHGLEADGHYTTAYDLALIARETMKNATFRKIVSTHKYVVKQATLFELSVAGGRLFVCAFNMKGSDPAAAWLKNEIIKYMQCDKFEPKDEISLETLREFANTRVIKTAANTNLAFNPNDKTAVRKKK